MCMTQVVAERPRDENEAREFGAMLKNCNLLYIGMHVLVLFDQQYAGRFFTNFESCLAMQWPTPEGLKPAVEDGVKFNYRCDIVDVYDSGTGTMLIEKLWLKDHSTFKAVMARLAQPDIEVTNKKDKETLIPRLDKFNKLVMQGAAQGMDRWLAQRMKEYKQEQEQAKATEEKKAKEQRNATEANYQKALRGGATAKAEIDRKNELNKQREQRKKELERRQREQVQLFAQVKPLQKELKKANEREQAAKEHASKLEKMVQQLEEEVRSLGGHPGQKISRPGTAGGRAAPAASSARAAQDAVPETPTRRGVLSRAMGSFSMRSKQGEPSPSVSRVAPA